MKRGKGLLVLLTMTAWMYGQGFITTKGDSIVDGSGNNFIIRSLGTGNWMIMEGYMMQTWINGGTHTGFRDRLIEEIGVANADSFYTVWLNNHFSEADVDSMVTWGFNTVRPALHYRWFTLPIEEEPVAGEQTWLETGFILLDSLVKWCKKHELYIVLDMHGAPGGQGGDRAISDYDPTKPSLWESEENKNKLIELWGRIAERYSEETIIIGYDLINEPNWDLPGGTALRELYGRITDKIREVDQNHIIFIEGNWFANDFTGLTPPWDDNMVYSFHKYWTANGPGSLGYGTWLRDAYNVPVWLGETGENSNVWFASLAERCEVENVGWSFWPVKKGANSNVLNVDFNEDYHQLIDSWQGGGSSLTAEEAFQAVLTLADRHLAENCIVQYDVIDAMIRQPFTDDLKPFRVFDATENIYATDYALGRHGFAYVDQDTGNYSGAPGGGWNAGGAYRNDGVDIQACEDTGQTNGFNVGWTAQGEWMVYHVRTDSVTLMDVVVRSASGSSSGGSVILEADGEVISEYLELPSTGGWQTWTSTTFSDILLPAGLFELKMRITGGGSNLNYLRFENPRSPEEVDFRFLFAETSVEGNQIYLHMNKPITSNAATEDDFTLKAGIHDIAGFDISWEDGSKTLILEPQEILPYNRNLFITYTGDGLQHEGETLPTFSEVKVENNLQKFPTLPGRIQAEDYLVNVGFELEECDDTGGGLNTAYASPGDYLEYVIYTPEAGTYSLNLRVALNAGNSTLAFEIRDQEGVYETIGTLTLTNTGGWQTWETQSTQVDLPEGKYRFRIRNISGENNINWIEFEEASSLSYEEDQNIIIFPNPTNGDLQLKIPFTYSGEGNLIVHDATGRWVGVYDIHEGHARIPAFAYEPGLYFVLIHLENRRYSLKFVRN